MLQPIDKLKIHPISTIKGGDFISLLSPSEDGGTVATLLLPMEKMGVETRKNPIVFKNALKKAQEMLKERQGASDEIGQVLDNLKSLENPATDFWQHQENGLALVVRSSGELTAFKTPFPLEEFVWIGKRPRLGRLMPLADELRFYILALDLNKLRLFEATRWDVHEIEIEHGPTSLGEAMKYDDPEKTLQHHSTGASTGDSGKVDVVHHGQGGGTDDTKAKNIQHYFQMTDKNLADNFPDRNTTLVLFGPDSEVGSYRDINSYPHLHEDDIRFNPSHQSDEELIKRMLSWVQEQAVGDAAKSLENLSSHIGQDQGSAEFNEVIKAAFSGRVETLFVQKGTTHYGAYDPETHTVSSHDNDSAEADENELIEAAVMNTAAAGGQVRYVESGELPEKAEIAATFRF